MLRVRTPCPTQRSSAVRTAIRRVSSSTRRLSRGTTGVPELYETLPAGVRSYRSHAVGRFRADVPDSCSVADRFESYQCCASREMALEHSVSLTMPCDFDHARSKIGWTADFNDSFRWQRTHHPGFFSSVGLKQPNGGKRCCNAIPLHGETTVLSPSLCHRSPDEFK